MPEDVEEGNATPRHPRPLREVALLFLRLGFTAFGGPAAHVALMEDEVVTRRRWIDRQRFLDLVALLNFIPGPNSTELAIHLGLIRAGFRGLLVAGVCFIVPAVLIILPLAWAYERYGALPRVTSALNAINAGVIAVLAIACWRFARTSIKDRFTAVVAVLAAGGALAARRYQVPQAELIVLGAAAIAGAAPWWLHRRRALALLAPLPLGGGAGGAVTGSAAAGIGSHWLVGLVLFFLKVGATLFGSGYVLVSYLESGLVEQRGWLSHSDLLDAIAVGQVTPGPLLTTATFVGYVVGHRATGSELAGVVGGLAATAAIFLPAFVFVALLGRWLPRLRDLPAARGALDAANAAVAALVFVITVTLAAQTLRDPLSIAIAAMGAAALALFNLNATWVMLVAAVIGFARGWWIG
jgi:chromate transporter